MTFPLPKLSAQYESRVVVHLQCGAASSRSPRYLVERTREQREGGEFLAILYGSDAVRSEHLGFEWADALISKASFSGDRF